MIQIQKSAKTQMRRLRKWLNSLGQAERKGKGPVESLKTRKGGEPKKIFEKLRQASIRKKQTKKQPRAQGHIANTCIITEIEKVGKKVL